MPIDTKLDATIQSAIEPAVPQADAIAPATPQLLAGPMVETPQTQQAEPEDGQLLWPMMPNETVAQLAKTFYPDSPILE